jgi:hypothetical protein
MIVPPTKKGGQWEVRDSSGKQILGQHKTKKKAIAQLRAIEASKRRRGKK